MGSALATLGPRVAYIWNHYAASHEANHLTYAYLSAGLQTHLWAGVFPTVPIKNNDHAIGGDCAPNCSFAQVFSDFGPLFASLHGREWPVQNPFRVLRCAAPTLTAHRSIPGHSIAAVKRT